MPAPPLEDVQPVVTLAVPLTYLNELKKISNQSY
jgi:hypothetical protein